MKPKIPNMKSEQLKKLIPASLLSRVKGGEKKGVLPWGQLFSNVKSRVGLDIGSSLIKLVEVTRSPQGLELVNFAFGEAGADKPAESIKEVIKKAHISTKRVNISISGRALVVRYLELPRMKEEELKSSIRFEAGKHIPFNIKDVNLDSQILASPEEAAKMDVLLVAAKKDFVEGIIKTVNEAGLEPEIIDLDAFALINAFTASFPSLDNKINALLNIGAAITTISILRGAVPCFTREVSLGGNDITKSIGERLNMDFPSAEKLKCAPGERLEEIKGIAAPVLDNLLSEIRLSFDYYESHFEQGISRIYLSGGCSKLKGLDAFLNQSLGLEVQAWDPTDCVKISPKIEKEKLWEISAQLAVAIGLALRDSQQ